MTESRQHISNAAPAERRDALRRLSALVDATIDDLTRELQMRVALSGLDAPAMLVDLDLSLIHISEPTRPY